MLLLFFVEREMATSNSLLGFLGDRSSSSFSPGGYSPSYIDRENKSSTRTHFTLTQPPTLSIVGSDPFYPCLFTQVIVKGLA